MENHKDFYIIIIMRLVIAIIIIIIILLFSGLSNEYPILLRHTDKWNVKELIEYYY